MHAVPAPEGTVSAPAFVSLSLLSPRTAAIVKQVGSPQGATTPMERRLIELGFVAGERIEVITQARPGGDPFVVRVGETTLALRRHEVETVWVELAPPAPRP